jgi:hypothetical protein
VDQLTGRVARLLLAPVVLLGAVACSSSSATTPSIRPAPSSTTSPSPATSPVTVPSAPVAQPGLRTLVLMPRQTGSSRTAVISIVPGDVTATMLCTGGELQMYLDPVASATVQCDRGAVSPVRNVFRVKTGAKGIKVRVTAGPGVVWNLRVEER